MGLKKITSEQHIDALQRGDQVEFFPDLIRPDPWTARATFEGQQLYRLNFIAPAASGDSLYFLSLYRGDVMPTTSGAIERKDRTPIGFTEITPEDPHYELYRDLVAQE